MFRTVWPLLLAVMILPAQAAFIATEKENNDAESRANGPIGPGVALQASLSSRRDVDWFWFDLAQPGRIQISLDHAAANDFDWALYGASGPALARGETSAVPETGGFDATAAGRYFLRIASYRGSGSYRLDVDYPLGAPPVGPRPVKPGNLRSWITGNPEDSGKEPLGGPGLLLMGGNFDIDEAFIQRAYPIANGGDVVVLRASGSDGYNDYLYNLVTGPLKPDSVETLLIDTRDKADSDYADWVLRNAELIFIAGGNQSAYLNHWQGTRVQQAIRAAYERGAVIGGISAGLAVQGEWIYDPDGVTAVTSSEALADPYRSGMLFSTGFLDLPLLRGVITDTHFFERDRMGRLMAFMARLRQDGVPAISGLAVDENTSLFIDRHGEGVVDGDGCSYVLRERSDTQRVQVAPGQPLVYRNLDRTRLCLGDRYHFGSGASTGSTTILSVDARNASPFSPVNPY